MTLVKIQWKGACHQHCIHINLLRQGSVAWMVGTGRQTLANWLRPALCARRHRYEDYSVDWQIINDEYRHQKYHSPNGYVHFSLQSNQHPPALRRKKYEWLHLRKQDLQKHQSSYKPPQSEKDLNKQPPVAQRMVSSAFSQGVRRKRPMLRVAEPPKYLRLRLRGGQRCGSRFGMKRMIRNERTPAYENRKAAQENTTRKLCAVNAHPGGQNESTKYVMKS